MLRVARQLLYLPPLVVVSFSRGLDWFFGWWSWVVTITQLLVNSEFCTILTHSNLPLDNLPIFLTRHQCAAEANTWQLCEVCIIDPVKYFPDPRNRDLCIIKRKRKLNVKLIVAPFPEIQRGSNEFFFNNFLKAS